MVATLWAPIRTPEVENLWKGRDVVKVREGEGARVEIKMKKKWDSQYTRVGGGIINAPCFG